jgi:hypothetical protein
VLSPRPVRHGPRQAPQRKSSGRYVPLSCDAWRGPCLTGRGNTGSAFFRCLRITFHSCGTPTNLPKAEKKLFFLQDDIVVDFERELSLKQEGKNTPGSPNVRMW